MTEDRRETPQMPKSDFRRFIAWGGAGLMIGAIGIIFAVYDAVNKSDANSTILSCDNLINHEVAATDNHWLFCLISGNQPWECRRGKVR